MSLQTSSESLWTLQTSCEFADFRCVFVDFADFK